MQHGNLRKHARLATTLVATAACLLAVPASAQLPAFFSDGPTTFLGYVRAVANTSQVCEDRSSGWSSDVQDYPLPAGAANLSGDVVPAVHIHGGTSIIDFTEFVVDSSGLALDFDFDLDLVGCEREGNNVNSVSETIAPPTGFFVPTFAITVTEDVDVEIGGNIGASGTGIALSSIIQLRDSSDAIVYQDLRFAFDSAAFVFEDFAEELPPGIYSLRFQFGVFCRGVGPCEPSFGAGRFFIRMTAESTPLEDLGDLIDGLDGNPPTVDGEPISTDPADGDMTGPNSRGQRGAPRRLPRSAARGRSGAGRRRSGHRVRRARLGAEEVAKVPTPGSRVTWPARSRPRSTTSRLARAADLIGRVTKGTRPGMRSSSGEVATACSAHRGRGSPITGHGMLRNRVSPTRANEGRWGILCNHRRPVDFILIGARVRTCQ